nr:hypothetical protein [Nostoc sp. ChiSLP01]
MPVDGHNKTTKSVILFISLLLAIEALSLFCHFPSILNKRIMHKKLWKVSRVMDVELQILKHLARDAHPTVAIVDEYCVEYKDLFKIP